MKFALLSLLCIAGCSGHLSIESKPATQGRISIINTTNISQYGKFYILWDENTKKEIYLFVGTWTHGNSSMSIPNVSKETQ